MQGHRRRGRLLWLVLPLLVSCGTLKKLSPDTVRSTLHAAASGDVRGALNRATGGVLSANAELMIRTLGPLAIQAVGAIRDTIVRRQAEKRSREARREEEWRLGIAAAQIFYAGQCIRSIPELGAAGAVAAGPENPARLESQASEAFGRGDYSKAEPLLKRAHELRKMQLGASHPDTARTLNKWAGLELAVHNLAPAMGAAVDARAEREKLLKGIKSTTPPQAGEIAAALDVAESDNTIAAISNAAGKYAEAKPAYERALELRKRYLGAGHLCVAESQNGLGELLQVMGAYPAARAAFENALAIRERVLGPQHRDTAQSVNDLASLYRSIGDYGRAEELYQRALDIREKTLCVDDKHRGNHLFEAGRQSEYCDHPDIAKSLTDLGDLYKLSGEYAKAESRYKDALRICQNLDVREKKMGGSLETAESQNALAGLYQKIGKYDSAEGLYQTAFFIRQKTLGADHPDTAESLGDLGSVAFARRNYPKAESIYKQALAIRRKAFGTGHPLVADSLAALGSVHLALDNYATAEAEYKDALGILEKTPGLGAPAVAQSRHRLGAFYQAKGDYPKAEQFYLEALKLREETLGADHPDVAESHTQLSTLMAATGRAPQAIKHLREAVAISEKLLGSVGSRESRMDALLRILRTQEEIAYSLVLETASPAEAAQLAISVALLRKGRSLDEAASFSRAINQDLTAADTEKVESLKLLRAQINNLTLSSDKDNAADVECLVPTPVLAALPQSRIGKNSAEIECLKDKADRLEQELAERSAPLRAKRRIPGADKIVASVADALNVRSSDEALVEIVAFRPYMFRAKGQAPHGELHYLALVLHRDAKVLVADLGPGKRIDDAIAEFRKQITRAPESPQAASDLEDNYQMLKSAEALYQLVFQPVRQLVDADKSILLSLDSQLNLVPFAALFDGKKYLVDTYQLTYLTSGRDLLRTNEGLQLSTNVEVIANPEFIKQAKQVPGSPSPIPASRKRGLDKVEDGAPMPAAAVTSQKAAVDRALHLPHLPELKGTGQEANKIRGLADNHTKVEVIQRSKATKKAFLDLKSPGILHVATHGYVQKGSASFANSRGIDPVGESSEVDDQLQNSMLILAGAGVPGKSDDGHDEIVVQPEDQTTARDVAGMNLWGTQLVVLSACETGLGDVTNLGQGVYGLRRAVMAAGAETLVTSLWSVDDEVTRDLMVNYYRKLFAGQDRAKAMRESAAAVRKRKRHQHPYYWAPFIVIGSSDRLSGIGKNTPPASSKKQSAGIDAKDSRPSKKHSRKEHP